MTCIVAPMSRPQVHDVAAKIAACAASAMIGPSSSTSARLNRIAGSEESRTDIDDEIDRNPDADSEIPIEAVVGRVAKRLDGHPFREEEDRQADGVANVDQQQGRVKNDNR